VSELEDVLGDSAEELFEDAPCGYLTTALDGRIVKVNRTFETWTGLTRADLIGARRFMDLLSPGGRIFYETHLLPLLLMQGWVREIAVEVKGAGGRTLPALVNAVLRRDAAGEPRAIRVTVFDATDRRRYEEELLRSRNREHEIARRLQESLLEGVLTDDARLPTGIAYVPSAHGLQVGGDWYDAFAIAEDRIALVVGDVVGRGLEAAATMGQLRSAIRALASTGLGPGALLGALDAYAHRHDVGRVATVAYAEIDVARGAMVLGCAGHMPPAVLEPGEPARYVLEGRSAPLDVYRTPTKRPEAEVRFAAGALLAFFTDGLIERATEPLDDSLDALLAELDRRRDRAPQALADEVTAAMLDGVQTKDDVCLVVVQWAGPGDRVARGDPS
jgi:sigma-B regulation protein RsbU (phosphoserine phosphatase)